MILKCNITDTGENENNRMSVKKRFGKQCESDHHPSSYSILNESRTEEGPDMVSSASTLATNPEPSAPGSKDRSMKVPPVAADTTELRRVLRLVHCLQQERGASCAYYASRRASGRGTNAGPSFGGLGTSKTNSPLTLLPVARTATDRALNLLRGGRGGSHVPTAKTLERIRNMLHSTITAAVVAEAIQDSDGTSKEDPRMKGQWQQHKEASFHKMLVCFNTLISSVIHSHILVQTTQYRGQSKDEKRVCTKKSTSSKTGGNWWDRNIPKAKSHGHLNRIPATVDGGIRRDVTGGGRGRVGGSQGLGSDCAKPRNDSRHHRRCHSDNTLATSHQAEFSPVHELYIPPVVQTTTALPGATNTPTVHPSKDCRVSHSVPASSSLSTFPHAKFALCHDIGDDGNSKYDGRPEVSFVDSNGGSRKGGDEVYQRIVQLLMLLDIFVRLKESTGVERATLCSIVAVGEDEFRLLMAELIVEIENQRRELRVLFDLPSGPLRNLVQELVTVSSEMEDLQNRILNGNFEDWKYHRERKSKRFDHHAFSNENLWDMLTLYIDKLHSLELLIVEEIEYCCPQSSVSTKNEASSVCCSADRNSDTANDMSPFSGNKEVSKQQYARNALRKLFALEDAGSGSISRPGHKLTPLEEDKSGDGTALIQYINSLPPDKIKDIVLSTLSETPGLGGNHVYQEERDARNQQTLCTSVQSQSKSSTRVDDLLEELSEKSTPKEWEIDIYEIRFMQRIGQGTAGTTYLADWNELKVAVKVASISEMGLDGWRTEVEALQRLHHPNIIRLLGSVIHQSPLTFCLVLEYCSAGDLSGALTRSTPRNFFSHTSTSIAKGMHYLHRRGIVHRDIKPANILLDGDVASGHFDVKVTDFGVASENIDSRERTAETGTYRWMAPEVIRAEAYSRTADVYSFAVVMWQLLTREDPFADKNQIEAAAGVAIENARPPFPTGTPEEIAGLVRTCWDEDPEKRFPFDEIGLKLVDIEKHDLTEDGRRWIEAPLGHPVYEVKKDKQVEIVVENKKAIPRKSPRFDVAKRNGEELEHPKYGRFGGKKKERRIGFRSLFSRKSSYF